MHYFSLKSIFQTFFLVFILHFAAFAQDPDSLAGQEVEQDQDKPDKPGLFDLLVSENEAEITIVLDWDTLMANVKTNNYYEGEFRFTDLEANERSIPVRIKPRGRFRRMKCDFPPLKLKFKKDDLKDQGLKKFNEFKLVTHCLDDADVSEELIMREYLTYKLYSQLTPYSLRVQLVKVTYQHEKRKTEKTKRWGILIEDVDDLAKRTNSKIVSRIGIPLDSLHINQEKIVSTFQYMIGNCDWSYLMARNTEFIQLPEGELAPIPYDFDYSGLVNAPYARFDPNLGQTSIRDRVYLGFANSAEEMNGVFSYFRTKKDDLYQVIDSCTHLNRRAKKDIREYLDSFYNVIKDKGQFEASLVLHKRKK